VVKKLKITVLSSSFQMCGVKNSILKTAFRVTMIVNHHNFLAHPVYRKQKRSCTLTLLNYEVN